MDSPHVGPRDLCCRINAQREQCSALNCIKNYPWASCDDYKRVGDKCVYSAKMRRIGMFLGGTRARKVHVRFNRPPKLPRLDTNVRG